jgi:glycosyltransferase involved in cell wall biosynthesis
MGAFIRRTMLPSEPRNRLDFNQVLCVSAYVQDYLVEEAGVPRDRTQVVHNGVEIDLFRYPSRTPSHSLRLLYAGRLSPDKGAHTLVESLTILRSEAPDLPLEVSIYGKGVPEYENHMKAIAATHQIESWLKFKGNVPREQMPQVFAEHDVLVFPSIWPEPLARVVQEAMACGLVVIGTTTGGTPELLQDGKNGLTFPAEDARQLATKIELVVKDRDLRARLAAAARQTIEQRFTLGHMVDQLEGIFAQLVAQAEGSVDQT